MARRGAGTDTPPENPRRVIGLFNMAAVCLISRLSAIGVHWSLTLFALFSWPAPPLVAHLVRDEGVAGSNPATPTTFPELPIAYAASYAERNARRAAAAGADGAAAARVRKSARGCLYQSSFDTPPTIGFDPLRAARRRRG
jgi:hypothetical protein